MLVNMVVYCTHDEPTVPRVWLSCDQVERNLRPGLLQEALSAALADPDVVAASVVVCDVPDAAVRAELGRNDPVILGDVVSPSDTDDDGPRGRSPRASTSVSPSDTDQELWEQFRQAFRIWH